MSNVTSVKISINGVHYFISTTENEEYVRGLSVELDEQVKAVVSKNPTLSFNDVMVLCAMNYVDAYKRSEENADRMRTQISEYLEDASKARMELDETKRELATLRREITTKANAADTHKTSQNMKEAPLNARDSIQNVKELVQGAKEQNK